MVVALLAAPGAVKDTDLDPAQIVSSYFFYPYERHDGRIAPVLSLGWTLNYEMFFYLLAAAALFWRRPHAGVILWTVLLTLALFGWLLDPQQSAVRFWTNSIILEFGFGVLLALVWQRRGTVHNPAHALALFLTGVAALLLLHGTALPRFLPNAPDPLSRLGSSLGDASYALYLSHRFVLRLATLALLPLVPATSLGLWSFVAGVTLAATLLSLAVFRHIERPLLARLNRRLSPAPA
jgi:peptidoglycan/LPS O-acetylase OafA/YrhL